MANQMVAKEILSQMGGEGKVSAMIAREIIYRDNGVRMSVARGAKDGIQYVSIALQDDDTYLIEATKFGRRSTKATVIYRTEGVMAEGLKGAVERITGLYLSL